MSWASAGGLNQTTASLRGLVWGVQSEEAAAIFWFWEVLLS